MAFDLEKLKKNFVAKKDPGKNNISEAPAKWDFTNRYPKLAEFKAGVRDIQNVLAEGKFSLFVKQIAVLAAVFLLVRTINGKLSAHRSELKDKMTAITIQQTNKQEYLNNKDHLLRLEPLFPDVEKKSDWMPSTLMTLFNKHDLDPKLDGNFTENAQQMYTVVSQNISWKQSYKDLGKMLADMENGDAFLRASDVTISKLTGKEELGNNTVTVKFNTVFPKTKYAPKLFKDYKQQMEKIKAQQEKAAKATGTKTEETK